MSEQKANLYPSLTIGINKNPNKMYAIPFFGAVIKVIILIPVFLILLGLSIASAFLLLVNAFMVLFNGKYWDVAYDLVMANMRYTAKTSFFFAGITDTYPGFDLQIRDSYSVDMPRPQNPSKLFAIPVFGALARVLLMIPFSIFSNVISTAAGIGVFLTGWVFVLFTGKYPEALYEIYRDSVRLSLASNVYMAGLSDKYPSFWISMNHKNVKVALIIIAIIVTIFQFISGMTQKDSSNQNQYQNQYQNLPPQQDQSTDFNYQ